MGYQFISVVYNLMIGGNAFKQKKTRIQISPAWVSAYRPSSNWIVIKNTRFLI